MAKKGKLNITRRKLPHWTLAGSIYFITFKLRHGYLAMAERSIVFDHIRSGDPQFYEIIALVVMSNHVHLLITLKSERSLSKTMQAIKGVTARKINRKRGRKGSLWISESYDHIIRNQRELDNTIDYIQDNPRRAGLIANGQDYPFSYISQSTF